MLTLVLFLLIIILPERLRINIIIFIMIFSFNVTSILPPATWFMEEITLENLLFVYFIIFSFLKGYLKKSRLTIFGKIALTIGIVFVIIQRFYVIVKDYLIFETEMEQPLRSLFKALLKIIIIYALIVYASKNAKNHMALLRMIFYSAAIYCFTAVFQNFFEQMGYVVRDWTADSDELIRTAGITRMNVNDFGALLVIVLGGLFNFFLLKKIKLFEFLFLTGFFVIGIFLTGSRTAMFSLAIIGLLFLTDRRVNFKKNTIFGFGLMLALVFILYFNYGYTVSSRIRLYEDVEYMGLGTRMGYWYLYWNDVVENPHYFLIGNTDLSTYKRSPHNYYVLLLFQSGLVFIFLMIALFWRLIRNYKKLKARFKTEGIKNPLYINLYFIIIPQLLFWIPAAAPPFYWFLILIGMIYFPDLKYNTEIVKSYTSAPINPKKMEALG